METSETTMPSTAIIINKPPTGSFFAFFLLKIAWLEKLDGAPWLPSIVDVVSSLTWARIGANPPECKAKMLLALLRHTGCARIEFLKPHFSRPLLDADAEPLMDAASF
jgi:hypothetical protein